ncbi:MAG: ribose-phosphate pyrophosphokinase [Phycisphaerae bacterium]|nr:ribose-phosphate pyrophosphokinase [Phycisphaerae bacterium]
MTRNDDIRIFSGTAHPELATKICEQLNVPVCRADIEPFPDGETHVRVIDHVRGRDCYIIQSTCPPVNENLMELLIFLDCLKRASAKRVTVVMPYFGYARQDRKSEGRTPITAKLVANLLTTASATRLLAIDLHAQQVQGFFDIPVDHLTAEPVIAEYFKSLDLPNKVIVSPDVGNMKTATIYAEDLDGELAVIDKRRKSGTEVDATRIIGEVEGKDVLMFDDMISTAGTICSAAYLVKSHGAKSIRVAATHGVFSGPAIQRLKEAPIDEIVVTDTIPVSDKVKQLDNLKVVTVAGLLSTAIDCIHNYESVSAIFKQRLI